MAKFDNFRALAVRLIAKNGSDAVIKRVDGVASKDPITQEETAAPVKIVGTYKAVGQSPGKTWQTRGNTLIGSSKYELMLVPNAYEPLPGDKIEWGGHIWSPVDFVSTSPDGTNPIVMQILVER